LATTFLPLSFLSRPSISYSPLKQSSLNLSALFATNLASSDETKADAKAMHPRSANYISRKANQLGRAALDDIRSKYACYVFIGKACRLESNCVEAVFP
jgi:hypothetical protein